MATAGPDELQANIRSLVVERNQLRDRLRRGVGPGVPGGLGRGRGVRQTLSFNSVGVRTPESEGARRNAKRERNTIDMVSHADDQGGQKPTAVSSEGTAVSATRSFSFEGEDFQVEKRPKVSLDNKTVSRTRNLFGSLVGHLKKAKDTLEKEKDTKQAEMHKIQGERVDQKLKCERRNLAELRRRELKEKKQNDVKRIREVQREITVKELELLKLNLETHYTRMMNFIRTRAEPTLFWLPAIHCDESRTVQGETRAAIEHKIESLNEQFNADMEQLQRQSWKPKFEEPTSNSCLTTPLVSNAQSETQAVELTQIDTSVEKPLEE